MAHAWWRPFLTGVNWFSSSRASYRPFSSQERTRAFAAAITPRAVMPSTRSCRTGSAAITQKSSNGFSVISWTRRERRIRNSCAARRPARGTRAWPRAPGRRAAAAALVARAGTAGPQPPRAPNERKTAPAPGKRGQRRSTRCESDDPRATRVPVPHAAPGRRCVLHASRAWARTTLLASRCACSAVDSSARSRRTSDGPEGLWMCSLIEVERVWNEIW